MLLRISIFISLLIAIGSCAEYNSNAQQTAEKDPVASVAPSQSSPLKQQHDPKFIYTEKQYSDSSGNSFAIINSLPKGGLNYTSPVGTKYKYTIFWHEITNESSLPLKLELEIPADTFHIPIWPESYFKVVIPNERMTEEKDTAFNYGIQDLNHSIDDLLFKSSKISKVIPPYKSYTFYTITLFNTWGKVPARAKFEVNQNRLIYNFNGKIIPSGSIPFLSQ